MAATCSFCRRSVEPPYGLDLTGRVYCQRLDCPGTLSVEGLRERLIAAEARVAELESKLNKPEFLDFIGGTVLEAAHQLERWPSEHDAGKTDADWLWLLGYLASKALHNPTAPGEDALAKKLHRIITVAAAAANWHAQVLGKSNMRPGIAPPAGEEGAA